MRSSISSSRAPTKADIVLVLAVCALFCLATEMVTALLFGRISRIERRREGEYRQALAVRSARTRGKTSVLVAGNSLLLHGVNFPELQREMGQEVELHRVVFEDTSYLDWYYGLNHIFHAGARPDVVVLLLSPVQLTSNVSVGDYGAHMLVDHRDLLAYARDVNADRNRTSVLALDNLSFFFGARAQVRTWLLGRILPDLPKLTPYFRGTFIPDFEVPSRLAAQRLANLHARCSAYGAAFVLAIPPTQMESGKYTQTVENAGAREGVPVLVPVNSGVLPLSDFSDAIHLNQQGAAQFTSLFAGSLRQYFLGTLTAQSSAPKPPLEPSASLRALTPNTHESAAPQLNKGNGPKLPARKFPAHEPLGSQSR